MSSSALLEKPAETREGSGTLFGWLPLADFFHLDTRSLALFRIGLALLLIYDYADRLPDVRAHYSDWGAVPRSALPREVSVSVHVLHGSAWWSGLLMVVGLLFAFALLVGYKTRFVLFISWFLLISMHARNPALLAGGDGIFRLALFWALFLPLGARFSLDAADHTARGGEPAPDRVVSAGSVALIAQICMVYLFASAWKWDPVWRTEGTAVFHALHVDHLTTRIGRWFLGFPDFLKFLTFATLMQETIGPVLLFVPFATGPMRVFTIASFLAFHAGLGMCMALSNFPFVCFAIWLVLLPTWFWDKLSAYLRTPARTGLVVHYDSGNANVVRKIAYLQTFLCLPDAHWGSFRGPLPLAGAPRGARWAVVEHDGKAHYEFGALAYLLWLSPVWWPLTTLLHLGVVKRTAKRLYQRQAAWPGERIKEEAPAPPPPLVAPLSAIQNAIVVFCLLYVFAWNVRSMDYDHYTRTLVPETVHSAPTWLRGFSFPEQVNNLGNALALDQSWNLFAPSPGRFKGWFVVQGTLADGRKVDLRRNGAPVSWEKPELVSEMYSNGRWRKFMMNLPNPYYAPLQGHYAAYLCRDWNSRHEGPERLEKVELFFMREAFNEKTMTFDAPEKMPMFTLFCNPQVTAPASPGGAAAPHD